MFSTLQLSAMFIILILQLLQVYKSRLAADNMSNIAFLFLDTVMNLTLGSFRMETMFAALYKVLIYGYILKGHW